MNDRSTLKILRVLLLAATVLFVLSLAVLLRTRSGLLDIYLPEGVRVSDFTPDSELVQIREVPGNERRMIVADGGRGRGPVFLTNTNPDAHTGFEYVKVLPGGVIYDMTNGNFSGSREVSAAIQGYVLILAVLSAVSFCVRVRGDLYSYTTLYMGGMTMFLTGLAADLLLNLVRLFSRPDSYFMSNVYSSLKGAGKTFMLLTLPLMFVLVAALAVSNVSLLRHEGRKFTNLLGLILCALIVAGYAGFFAIDARFFMGSERQMRLYGTLTSVYTTVFVYFETMLISAIVCGFISAVRKPSFDRTHIIILGCAVGRDGMPLPLLRGRIDKALRFAREQEEKTGHKAVFVPSGGQGADEAVSEAEAMRRYLVRNGIDPGRILPEDQSRNTRENMAFSLKKIQADRPDARIAFATSGYHVLRSGMISKEAGIRDAEGIGSRTKWYFWPNAFIREFVGLAAGKWREHFLWILVFAAAFLVINMLMPM